jgi:predicted RNA binding protein YcfA (HicA-like mRNA interferase family)
MNARLPTIPAKVMVQFLRSQGFQQARQKGSHRFFRHSDGRTATVPDHRGEDLGRGMMRKILRDAEVTRDDFLAWYLK